MKNTHEILAVQKDGHDYQWFNLIDKDGFKFTVSEQPEWIIDESVENAYMHIIKDENSEYGRSVKQCKILGNSTQIQNLLASLGWGTPDVVSQRIDVQSFSDASGDWKMAVWEMERVMNELKELTLTTK
jgi:hypothetical protein